jgi:hypothetical protein
MVVFIETKQNVFLSKIRLNKPGDNDESRKDDDEPLPTQTSFSIHFKIMKFLL